jgi:hypothetical protein
MNLRGGVPPTNAPSVPLGRALSLGVKSGIPPGPVASNNNLVDANVRARALQYEQEIERVRTQARARIILRDREERIQEALSERWNVVLKTMTGSWDAFMLDNDDLRSLWRLGIPAKYRARVWPLAIGNSLRITPALFDMCRNRAKQLMRLHESNLALLRYQQSIKKSVTEDGRTGPAISSPEGSPSADGLTADTHGNTAQTPSRLSSNRVKTAPLMTPLSLPPQRGQSAARDMKMDSAHDVSALSSHPIVALTQTGEDTSGQLAALTSDDTQNTLDAMAADVRTSLTQITPERTDEKRASLDANAAATPQNRSPLGPSHAKQVLSRRDTGSPAERVGMTAPSMATVTIMPSPRQPSFSVPRTHTGTFSRVAIKIEEVDGVPMSELVPSRAPQASSPSQVTPTGAGSISAGTPRSTVFRAPVYRPAALPIHVFFQGREETISLIHTDLPRTFPWLNLFGPPDSPSEGPLHAHVRDVLEAFVCVRPDMGYVQGMSYLAAMIAIFTGGVTVVAAPRAYSSQPKLVLKGQGELAFSGGIFSSGATSTKGSGPLALSAPPLIRTKYQVVVPDKDMKASSSLANSTGGSGADVPLGAAGAEKAALAIGTNAPEYSIPRAAAALSPLSSAFVSVKSLFSRAPDPPGPSTTASHYSPRSRTGSASRRPWSVDLTPKKSSFSGDLTAIPNFDLSSGVSGNERTKNASVAEEAIDGSQSPPLVESSTAGDGSESVAFTPIDEMVAGPLTKEAAEAAAVKDKEKEKGTKGSSGFSSFFGSIFGGDKNSSKDKEKAKDGKDKERKEMAKEKGDPEKLKGKEKELERGKEGVQKPDIKLRESAADAPAAKSSNSGPATASEHAPKANAIPPPPSRRAAVPSAANQHVIPLTVADDRYVTFQVLANLLTRHHLYVFFAMDTGPLAPFYEVWEHFLYIRNAALYEHLHSMGIQTEMYLFGWFQTIFVKCLPFASVARVWDEFLMDGVPHLYKTAMAIMDLLSPYLLGSQQAFEDTVQVLTQAPTKQDIWAAVGEPEALLPAIASVQIPPDFVKEMEDLVNDPFFFRRIGVYGRTVDPNQSQASGRPKAGSGRGPSGSGAKTRPASESFGRLSPLAEDVDAALGILNNSTTSAGATSRNAPPRPVSSSGLDDSRDRSWSLASDAETAAAGAFETIHALAAESNVGAQIGSLPGRGSGSGLSGSTSGIVPARARVASAHVYSISQRGSRAESFLFSAGSVSNAQPRVSISEPTAGAGLDVPTSGRGSLTSPEAFRSF